MTGIDEIGGGLADLNSLDPEETLIYFDGPRLFTVMLANGMKLIAYQYAENDRSDSFILAPASDALIKSLEKNLTSLREALTFTGWAWTVERLSDGSLDALKSVDLARFPQDYLPKPYLKLSPEPDLISLRLLGEGLSKHSVPASAIRRAVDGATGAVKSLVSYAMSLEGGSGRPPESIRRYYDLPATDMGFGSFCISFGFPKEDHQLKLEDTESPFEVAKKLLNKGLNWAALTEENYTLHGDEWERIIEALSKIAPPQTGPVKAVEVGGYLSLGNQKVLLNRRSGYRIRRMRKLLLPSMRRVKIEGKIRELDKDKYTFILRGDHQKDSIVSFSEEQSDDVWFAFETDSPVAIGAEENTESSSKQLISIIISEDEYSDT